MKASIGGESYEFTEMYPGFIEQARAEGNEKAETSFIYANKVEKVHHGLYQKALELLEASNEAKAGPYFVCPVCGYTVAGEAPEKCPVCGTPRSKFKKVE